MATDVDQRHRAPEDEAGPPLGLRLLGFAPAAAFLLTFGLFFLDKGREARTVLGSGRGLLTAAVLVVGYLVVGFVLRRTVRLVWLPPVVLTAAVLGLAAWIVRPYYVDETANQELVQGPVRRAPSEPAGEPPDDGAPAAEAVLLGTGPLQGIDHDAAGSASLIRAPDGAHVVRFEDFEIEGVPDPQVYLVEGEDVRDPGGAHLGRLPGNQGDVLDLAVPDGTDPAAGWTVLVWCGSFSVPVANGTFSA